MLRIDTVGKPMTLEEAEILATELNLEGRDVNYYTNPTDELPSTLKEVNRHCVGEAGIKAHWYEKGGLVVQGNIIMNALDNSMPLKNFPKIHKLIGNLFITGISLFDLKGAPNIVTGSARFSHCGLTSTEGTLYYVGKELDISNNPIHSFINNNVVYSNSLEIKSTHIESMDYAPRIGSKISTTAGLENDQPQIAKTVEGAEMINDYLICVKYGSWSSSKTLLENLKETVQLHPECLTEFPDLRRSKSFLSIRESLRGVVLTSDLGIV